jgi:hypothetical protein
MKKVFLILLLALLPAFYGCNGTETGNPSADANGYSNAQFGVAASYADGWSAANEQVPIGSSNNPGSSSSGEGIDVSGVPATIFTDGLSVVSLYYVTLSTTLSAPSALNIAAEGASVGPSTGGSTPTTLEGYLEQQFPERSFTIAQTSHLSGFTYDNPELGTHGGDQKEYYFVNGKTLLYVVTDLFDLKSGVQNFEVILSSLRFQ